MEKYRIELHSHSRFSDGLWSPENMARRFQELDVRYASLTDHDTLAGLDEFESACERYGVAFIAGLELTFHYFEKELHLLCHGFDRHDPALNNLIRALREHDRIEETSFSTERRIGLKEILDTVHAAGGLVSLAHPIHVEQEMPKLERVVQTLASDGLDGLEVFHPSASAEQQEQLGIMAEKFGLLLLGGTDYHGTAEDRVSEPGLPNESPWWPRFKAKLIELRERQDSHSVKKSKGQKGSSPHYEAKAGLLISMILPATAAFVLFSVSLFGFFLPRFEQSLFEKKKEMIRELTNTVRSLLDEAEREVLEGKSSRAAVQKDMISKIRSIRYGKEKKDYFWIQDLSPRMILHPYRQDLEGQSLADFKDPRGERIFLLFAEKALKEQTAYVDYVWQWKDDPARMEMKESYIQLFEPWGWVIGTGIYMEDVAEETNTLKSGLIQIMSVILLLLVLLHLLMLRNGFRAEALRIKAEKKLHESIGRYSSLVRAAEEGILLVRKSRCLYANPVFLELSGFGPDQLALLDLEEIFPELDLGKSQDELKTSGVKKEIRLVRKGLQTLQCQVTVRILQGEPEDLVIVVRRSDLDAAPTAEISDGLLKRILNLPTATAEDLARNIASANTSEDVIVLCKKIETIVPSALETGASSLSITSMITSVTDAATARFIGLAQERFGEAPCPFVFMAFGSQGRKEQTLFTDQDNAIIFTPGTGQDPVECKTYFLRMAEEVTGNLLLSGYRRCKGEVMASNPEWCLELDSWKDRFAGWMNKAEDKELMEFGTFFDLRCIFGSEPIVHSLREHTWELLGKNPWFLVQAATNALAFKSPIRLFGSMPSTLDLKVLAMPIISFARLYSLKSGIRMSGTSDRLAQLRDKGILLPSQHHNIQVAFESLMRLRLRHQSDTIKKGAEADNTINTNWLGHMDEVLLKECFREIDRLQERITREFLGGGVG